MLPKIVPVRTLTIVPAAVRLPHALLDPYGERECLDVFDLHHFQESQSKKVHFLVDRSEAPEHDSVFLA